MLNYEENPVLRIVGVEHLQWKEGTFSVRPRSYCVLSFRICGSATIQGGGSTCYVQPNDVLYLPQSMAYTADYTDTQILCIHFETLRDDGGIACCTCQNGEQLAQLFWQAHTLWESREPGAAAYVMARLYEILGALQEQETKAILHPRFLKAVTALNAGYTDPDICVDRVCHEAGIGATLFRQLMRKHYQQTATQYITDLRLKYARSLICSGVSIEKAAYDSGFNDPKYFARVVKKYLGCTPRDLKVYGK